MPKKKKKNNKIVMVDERKKKSKGYSKRKSKARTAQDTIPFDEIYENGMFRSAETFSILLMFENIDYKVLRENEKDMFYENLGTVCIVEIEEDKARGDVARSFLKRLAKEKNVGADEALLSFVKDDEVYIATELQKAFDEWYNNKLKTKIYPQYKNISTVAKTVGKAAPKGVAYDELKEMVGLKEAKSVIYKAINYYKIQKLFEERGLKTQKPTMHMVFTGNPGTAKTSVARLFARIMRDNGLVSRGQLVEVGRGDLVGKYIGWTAQIVQKKFREAMGGVLFIDEAYSLVDWHKGSYGDEAISTIVQEMENHREDVVVIFAGYPNEMDLFLERTPGLRSRIAFHVPFADYSAEELCEMSRQRKAPISATADMSAT